LAGFLLSVLKRKTGMDQLYKESIQAAMSYQEYRELIDRLRAEDKTTGTNHSEAFLYYTDLNINRMIKWDKRYQVSDDLRQALANLEHEEHWLLITEAWCGDAAHSVPMIAKMAASAPGKIELHLVLRDEHLPLMDRHLTNGGRSIPKLVRINAETGEIVGEWGPRPAPAQALMLDLKNDGASKEEINLALQKWYAKDRGRSIDQEMLKQLA
jgi:hypothetical protein